MDILEHKHVFHGTIQAFGLLVKKESMKSVAKRSKHISGLTGQIKFVDKSSVLNFLQCFSAKDCCVSWGMELKCTHMHLLMMCTRL